MNKESNNQCGTYTKYTDGCRCQPCKVARSEYRSKYAEDCKLGFGEKKLSVIPLLNFVGEIENSTLAAKLKVEVKTVRAWRKQQCGLSINRYELDVHRADQIAARLGVHPTAIWGEDWFRVPFFLTKKEQEIILG